MKEFGRKDYADYIRAIGIILVILGHTNFANSPLKEWIYAFHMPLFFFTSGLTLKKIDEVSVSSIKGYILKKIKTLLVPYFLWGLLYAGLSSGSVVRLLYGSYSAISSAGSLSSLWFLPTMFAAVCIAQAILLISGKQRKVMCVLSMIVLVFLSVSLPAISTGYPFCFDAALTAAAFILLGYLVDGQFVKKGKTDMTIRGSVIALIVGFAGTMLFRVNPINSDSYVLMARMRVGDPFCFAVTAVSGCVMMYGLARLAEYSKFARKLRFFGMNSLGIFAIHKPIIGFFGKLFGILQIPWWGSLTITCVGVLLLSGLGCKLINYFAPCLVGKNSI